MTSTFQSGGQIGRELVCETAERPVAVQSKSANDVICRIDIRSVCQSKIDLAKQFPNGRDFARELTRMDANKMHRKAAESAKTELREDVFIASRQLRQVTPDHTKSHIVTSQR